MFDPAAIQAGLPQERGPNVLTLLAQIWVRPRRTLAVVADGASWLWLAPLILALLLTWGRTLAAMPGVTAEQLAQNQATVAARLQDVPEEYRDALPEEATQVPEPSRVLVFWVPLALGVAGFLFGWLVRAAVLHVSSLAMGGRQSYGRIYRTAAWASFPLLLRDLVQTIYLAATGTVITGPGLSGLLTPTTQALPVTMVDKVGVVVASTTPVVTTSASPALTIPGILLGRIDLFSIWYVWLLGMAVLVAGKLSRGKAVGVVVIYVVLSLLTSLGQLVTQGITGGF